MGAHARQGPRLLHRLGPRRAHLGQSRLPESRRARHPLGRAAAIPSVVAAFADRAGDDRRSRKDVKPFEYIEANVPFYPPGGGGGTRENRQADADAARPGRVDEAHRPSGRLRAEAVRHRGAARRRQADLHELGRTRPAVGRRHGRLSQRDAAGGQGPRPHPHPRRHRRRRRGRQGHRLRRQAEHPDQPRRSPTAASSSTRRRTRCSSRTPTATTRPTCARCCSPAGAPATRTPGRATCATASTTGSTASSATPASTARSAASGTASARASTASRSSRTASSEAGVPAQHQQQLLGRRLQRGGPAVRLDGQRQPERLHADPEPLLRVGARLVVHGAAEHRRPATGSSRSPTRCGRSITTAASPPRPATPCTPPALIRRNTGTAPPSSPSRPAT